MHATNCMPVLAALQQAVSAWSCTRSPDVTWHRRLAKGLLRTIQEIFEEGAEAGGVPMIARRLHVGLRRSC